MPGNEMAPVVNPEATRTYAWRAQSISKSEAALSYANIGWPVFPLRPGMKTPATKSGFKDATTDPEHIRAWWSEGPAYNVGIATGRISGLTVLDPDGPHAPPLLTKDGLTPPETAVVRTPNGHHLYLAYNQTLKQGTRLLQADCLCPKSCGVDVRNDGGYVVAPPSIVNGIPYRWLREGGILSWPEISDYIASNRSQRRHEAPAAISGPIPEGQRESSIMRSIGAQRRVGGGYPELMAVAEVMNGRCDPPLTDRDLDRMVKSALRYTPTTVVSQVADSTTRSLEFKSYTAREFSDSEPETVDWVIEGIAARGTMTELDGTVKGGKTTLTLQAIRSITSGRPFLGRNVNEGKVVYVTEEPKASFRQALLRASLDASNDLVVIFKSDHPGIPWKALADYAVQTAIDADACLLACDTISGLAGFRDDDENSTGPAMEALEPLQTATSAGIAVWLNRHDRKSGGGLGSSGRGSSAMSGMVDTILHLTNTSSQGHENRRKIEGVSRFDGAPAGELIEFSGGEMRSIGDAGQVERIECIDSILEVVTMTERESGIQRKAIEEAIARITGKAFANTTITRALTYLQETGLLDRDKDPSNRRAFVYWRTGKLIDDSTKGMPPGILIDSSVLQNSTASINDSTPHTRGKIDVSTPQLLNGIDDDNPGSTWSRNGHDLVLDPDKVTWQEEVLTW